MENPRKFKKGTVLYTLGIFLNLVITGLLFTGAYFITDKGNGNVKELGDLAKEKGMYLVEKVYENFITTGGDVRDEDPEIVKEQNKYDARKYDINLSFDIPNKSIDGVVFMQASAETGDLKNIYVNIYNNLTVKSVQYVNIMRLGIHHRDITNIPDMFDVPFKQTEKHLLVTLNESDIPMKGDLFVLKITYNGTPVKKGFDSFSFKELYGNMYIYNLSEPTWGPVWWPSKDFPDDKALTSMHLRVPRGMKGVSNGLLTDTVQNDDNTTTFSWKTEYPIATYLVSIVVGNLVHWQDSYTSLDGSKTMPVDYFAFPKDVDKAKIDWKSTPEQIKFLSEKFGEYPFIDEKYGIAQFGWTSGAMEHQTITSYGYLLITGDNRYEHVAVHELAHHWFGDAVTLENWKNIWLNEGFASYCEALWSEYKSGKNAYFSYMKGFDYGYFSGTVYAPDGFIDNMAIYATIYQKGAWVLHMLRGVMGDEAFFNAVRAYYEKYKYKNANTEQLVQIMEEYHGSKLDWFFEQWVYKGTGRPRYEYSWKFEDFQGQKGSGKYTVRLQLNQVQKQDLEIYKMPLRITVVTAAGDKEFTVFNDLREQAFNFTVDSEPKEIIIDKDGWVLKKVAKGTYEKESER